MPKQVGLGRWLGLAIVAIMLAAACGSNAGPPKEAIEAAYQYMETMFENTSEAGLWEPDDQEIYRSSILELSPKDRFEAIREKWCIEYVDKLLIRIVDEEQPPSIILIVAKNAGGDWIAEIPNIFGLYETREEDYEHRWESCLLNLY